MSLKAIHIVFILASSVLALFLAFWSLREFFGPEGEWQHLLYAVLSGAGLAGLLVYGKYFLRKLKHIQLV